jgi:hypothetical protein
LHHNFTLFLFHSIFCAILSQFYDTPSIISPILCLIIHLPITFFLIYGAVMEDTLRTIEKSMAEGLQNYLLDPSVILQKLPRFTPHTKHPFFAEITAANLLAVPFNSKPDLLLHGLPVKLPPCTAIKASTMANTSPLSTAEMEDDEMHKLRAPTRRILELTVRLEMSAFPMKVITLMGVSGCGKTRTLLEVASMQFGLYFVVNNMGNGGSPDMAAMLRMLDIALRGTPDPDEAERIGEHHLYALLLSRLLVLQYLRKHTQNKKDLPFYWLLLQYRPNMFLPQGVGGDFFSSVFRSVVKCGCAEIEGKLDALLQEFYEAENTSLYIFSDESQVCLLSILLLNAHYLYTSRNSLPSARTNSRDPPQVDRGLRFPNL